MLEKEALQPGPSLGARKGNQDFYSIKAPYLEGTPLSMTPRVGPAAGFTGGGDHGEEDRGRRRPW